MPTINRSFVAKLALGAGVVCGLFVAWLLIFKPDGPPPEYMLDLLAVTTDVNEAKKTVENYYRASKTLDGVEKIQLPPKSAKPETLESLVVMPDGRVVASVAVRAKSSSSPQAGQSVKVRVNMTWRPLPSGNEIQWKCTGTPAEYLPEICR